MTNPEQDRSTPSEAASRAATQWLIAMQEQPEDTTLRNGFEAWRAAAPEHAAAWTETELLDGLIAANASSPIPVTPRRRKRPLVFAAAAFASAACLVLVLFPGLITRLSADAATGTAEIRNVTL